MPPIEQPPQRSVSPLREVVDELVWSRMSRFWSRDIDPDDREALTAVYESYLKALDADYVRLHQINDAKSIKTCPIYTQRRWLRLDLNRYQELQAWLRFLSGGLKAFSGGDDGSLTPSGTDTAECLNPPTAHTKHWHIHFPFRINGSQPDPGRRTINFHYPIIFSAPENPIPLAVLGLVDDENLFAGDDGEWAADHYVPGYIRRYPFALAADRQSSQDNPRMAIIVDADYEGVGQNPEIPFFDGEQPSEAMQQAMEFCQNYERDRIQTQRFAETLKGYDLLAQQMAQYTPEGKEPQAFARYVGVEEKRLQELPDDKYLELRKSNILPILYAQLMSMANWRTLLDRRARLHGLTGENVLKPRQAS